MNKLHTGALTILAVAGLAVPASARTHPADSHGSKSKPVQVKKVKPVPAAVQDCAADGDLDRVYAPGLLRRALRNFPADVGTYTDCQDVLRYAMAAGPVLPVNKRTARLRAKCTGATYDVSIAVDGTTIGTATVPACKRGAKIVRVPVTVTRAKVRRHRLATVVAKPDGKTLQFVIRLAGHKF
jgi:hypothetical protein